MKLALIYILSAWSWLAVFFLTCLAIDFCTQSESRIESYGDEVWWIMVFGTTGAGWLYYRHKVKNAGQENKMKVYICRWPNGDVSFVKAKNEDEAIYLLDEEGDADDSLLEEAGEFMLHLKKTGVQDESDDPEYEFEGFGEGLAESIYGYGVEENMSQRGWITLFGTRAVWWYWPVILFWEWPRNWIRNRGE
jgi:hypothetical protein